MGFLRGTGVALVTPFDNKSSIDFEGLSRMIHYVTEGEVDYIVALGTTAETSTLSNAEKLEVIRFIEQHTDKPIVVGHGGNNTRSLVESLDRYENFNIKGILSVTPYYNKPSQAGLIKHYEMLADASSWPIILYNVPSRTSCNIEAETAIELSRHHNIAAIKEASGDMNQIQKVLDNTNKETFKVLSGDDANTYDIIKMGGHGVISVIANYKPKAFSKMVKAALNGDWSLATDINNELKNDYKLLSAEGNPTSVKTALESLKLIKRHVRLPLIEGSDRLLENFIQ